VSRSYRKKASRGWKMWRAPLPSRLGSMGSVVSSPSGVLGRAPAEMEFGNTWMPNKPSGGTYFTECTHFCVQRHTHKATEVRARRSHGENKRLCMPCPRVATANGTLNILNWIWRARHVSRWLLHCVRKKVTPRQCIRQKWQIWTHPDKTGCRL